MRLRPYQEAAVRATHEAWKTHRSCLIVMATGLGKTVTFASIAKKVVESGKRVLVVAHTGELVRQAEKAMASVIGCEVDVEMADLVADINWLSDPAPVVVGTVQSLTAKRNGKMRVEKFAPRDFGLVIFDEAHHSVSTTWRRIAEYFDGCATTKRLGVTATPDRTDEEALGVLWDVCVCDYGIREGVEDGYLVPVRQSMVYVHDLDISGIRKVAGDLDRVELATMLERESVVHGMASATIQIARGRRTLCFCASVETARLCAEIIDRHEPGKAAIVSGDTEPGRRAEILKRFKDGELRYLCNCAVLTEGFDDPGIEVIAMMRPTMSRSLYTQIVGRGTRALPGVLDHANTAIERKGAIASSPKPSMLVVDFCGNAGRHRLVHAADILGGKDGVAQATLDRAAKILHKRAKAQPNTAVEEEQDVLAIIDQADRELKAEAEAKTRKLVRGTAVYSATSMDPFEFAGIAPRNATAKVGMPATPQQLTLLRKWRCPNPERLSRREATEAIKAIAARPSPAQAWTLRKAGLDPSKYTRKTASQAIDAIKRVAS